MVLGLVAAYFIMGAFVGYTQDAYVRSDLVAIAPEVSGIIQSVAVEDNARVKAGDFLAVIDPKPFELDVALKTQRVAEAKAAAVTQQTAEAASKAAVDAAQAALQLAQTDFSRAQQLTREQFEAQAVLDKATADLKSAEDALARAQAEARVSASRTADANVDIAVAEAELAIAQYALSRTRLTAPVSGYINNLTLRPGAYVAAGQAVIGIVDDSQWRVIANFKEDVASGAKPGTRVWVWLDSDPGRLYRGKVQGVGRAIARSTGPAELLPYVAPTTDWIRLRRRLPVTIYLDPPLPERGLFMGADARVFFFR